MKMFYLLICITLFSCSYSKNERNISVFVSNDNTSEGDKKSISNCFIKNVEYFRKYHRYGNKVYLDSPDSLKSEDKDYYDNYPDAEWDPANFFEPYATRFSLEKDDYIASPIPTSSQLNVTVDSIVYSMDSLFCVAFLIIESKYNNIEGQESVRYDDRRFDGKAVIGFRKSRELSFQIFPITKFSITGLENYTKTASELEFLYFNKLKGKGSTGGIYEGLQFNQNIGDKDFFEKSPYFQKHKNGLYNFQMYSHLGKQHSYNYQQCK